MGSSAARRVTEGGNKGGLCQGDPATKYNAWAFANLAPGDGYTGTIAGGTLTCTPKGFACEEPGCVKMTVQAGKITHAGMDCQ